MIVCPLCEHEQEFGLECERCGKDLGLLADLGPPPAGEERLDGLETFPGFASTEAVAGEAVEGLERTAFETVEATTGLVEEASPPIEPSAHGEVGAVPVEPLAEMTVDRYVDEEPPAPAADPGAQVTCKYCRHVQTAQRLCERCGMSLPWQSGVVVGVALGSAARRETEWTRCRACGAPAKVGERCGDCGREVPPPT